MEHEIPVEFSWLTELTVRIAYGPHPDAVPDVVFVLDAGSPDLGGQAWDDNEFIRELEPLTWNDPAQPTQRHPYELTVRKRYYSWGADGSGAGVLLYIANHLVDGGLSAVGAALALGVLQKLAKKIRPHRDKRFESSPEQLADVARHAVLRAYDEWLPEDRTLSLVGESRADDEWSGTFRDIDGAEYGVVLQPKEGQPYAVRVSRRS